MLLKTKLEELRVNYSVVAGTPFQHFFCPILLRDEKAELCKAHLLNQAFGSVSKKWTVQRADIDNFFGRVFESSFVELSRVSPIDDYMTGKSVSIGKRPQLYNNGEKVEYYFSDGPIPSEHSQVLLEQGVNIRRLAVKVKPIEMSMKHKQSWEFVHEKDYRLEALVSILKAAHLIMFDMVGYGYALSAGGKFLGNTILGTFFEENRRLEKADILVRAKKHFAQYSNLVRPVRVGNQTIGDTVSERLLYICEEPTGWAVLVTFKTSESMHAAVVPIMDSPEGVKRFDKFVTEGASTLRARKCHFDGRAFQLSQTVEELIWPEGKFS